ncbi:MAG TPA: hypothetical protein VGJ23_05575 [Gaiellaceae bacterium]|jgi:hypothetical protein
MLRPIAALIGVLSAVLLVPTALADQPVRTPAPPPAGTSFTLSGVCAFDVQVTFLVNKEYTLTRSDGAQIITGRLVVEFTNLSTDQSVVLNISGPVFTSVGSSTLILAGSSVIFYFPGDLGSGTPGALLLTHGPVIGTFGPTGALVSLAQTSASATDLCEVLA